MVLIHPVVARYLMVGGAGAGGAGGRPRDVPRSADADLVLGRDVRRAQRGRGGLSRLDARVPVYIDYLILASSTRRKRSLDRKRFFL